MKKENLVAYAAHFVSFLLDDDVAKNIDKIVLFGSVARGVFDEESDIDIFVDSKKNIEKEVNLAVSIFLHSEAQKKWELKGLKNSLSVKTGELNKWKLKRDILTDGILLYGKYKELPESTEYYLLINPSFKSFKKLEKVKLWRKLHGYKQKVGKKVYKTNGIVEKLGGKRIETGIIVSIKNKKELLDFLNEEKVPYIVNEIWSDTL